MKGLRQYINMHGRHFTERLAMDATSGRWCMEDIMNRVESCIYYNVTGSTYGDILFLVNYARDTGRSCMRTRQECIRFALNIVGEYTFGDGIMFMKWVGDNRNFDLTPYI